MKEARLLPALLAASTVICHAGAATSASWGGTGQQQATAVTTDAAGNTYIVGWTDASDFPVVNSAFARGGGVDAFLMKLDPSWNVLFATWLGGDGDDRATAVGLDAAGNIYVAGSTSSPAIAGITLPKQAGSLDGFVLKLNPQAQKVIYAVTLGGSSDDMINGMVVEPDGHVFVGGATNSANLPVRNAVQTTLLGSRNGFAAELDPSGTTVYCTYLGGTGSDIINGIAVDSSGAAWLAGGTTSTNFPLQSPEQSRLAGYQNAFVSRLSADGSALLFSTYLGGSGAGVTSQEQANAIALDSAGNAYVTGITSSSDFPILNAWQNIFQGWNSDAFVTGFSPAGTMLFSTFLGGTAMDRANSVAVLQDGYILVSGSTFSSDFPLATNPGAWHGGYNGFVALLSPAASALVFSSYIDMGQSDTSLAITAVNPAVSVGSTTLSSSPEQTRAAAIEVALPAPACTFTVAPASVVLDGSAASGTFQIDASSPGCEWTASAAQSWITITSGQTGQSSSTISWAISPNTSGADRTGSIVVGGQSFTIVQDCTTAQFNDVTPDATYFDAANLMFQAGITTGCIEGNTPQTRSFCPENNVTRGEMAAFIVRALTGTVVPASYPKGAFFNDVSSTYTFFPHIQKLMEFGITDGCSQSPPLYCPGDTIPRWEMAVFMIRARLELHGASFQYPPGAVFSDVPADYLNGFPFPFVQLLFAENITNGCGVDPLDFCPEVLVTRGQMASFIMRALFNQTTGNGPEAPCLTSATPGALALNAGSTVVITGLNTNFIQGDTVSVPSGLITAGPAIAVSATQLAVPLTALPGASPGPQSLVVTTGGQQLVLPNAIQLGTY